jgi:protein-L-isoaspartate(D-aspartate) O-methyltransferase
MDDMLELKEGQKVLEVGLGCGYHAAMTYRLVMGNGGRLITLEIDPRLEAIGRSNLERHFGSLEGIEILTGDGSLGYPDEAPFDRIYMTAAPDIQRKTFRRDILTDQLSEGGILLFPEKSEYALCHYRKSGGHIYETIHKGIVRFVGPKGLNV